MAAKGGEDEEKAEDAEREPSGNIGLCSGLRPCALLADWQILAARAADGRRDRQAYKAG
jgi:hypothetical protein